MHFDFIVGCFSKGQLELEYSGEESKLPSCHPYILTILIQIIKSVPFN